MAKISKSSSGLSRRQQAQLESVLLEFDRQWQPDLLAEFAGRLSKWPGKLALIELIRVDLERRWGEQCERYVEDYLSEFPELGTPATVAPELIHGEHQARESSGKPLESDELQRRFPAQAAQVLELIEAARDSRIEAGPTSRLQASVETSQTPTRSDQAVRRSAPATTLPEQFGRYRILRQLGVGAMGAVYLAKDTQLDRQVAIKTPNLADLHASDELVERFYREARAAASLHHPNICPVYDVGQIEGIHYISMAYIEGRPLSDYTRGDHPIPQRTAATLIRKLAKALAVAHTAGIIHRDLKPANIMVDRNRDPVVMDFGLARRDAMVEQSQMTQSGLILGTPAYMSPEQVEGLPTAIGTATDQYSLGVMLYEMLAGQLPFQGSVAAVMGKIMSQQPAPPRSLRPDLDPALEAICLRMMAKSPGARFDSLEEVSDALAQWLKSESPQLGLPEPAPQTPTDPVSPSSQSSIPGQDRQLRAFFAELGENTTAADPSHAVPPAISAQVAETRRRSSLVWIGLGMLSVFLLLLTGVVLLRTPHGILRIEVNHDDLEVLVDGAEISLRDNTWQGQQPAVQHELALRLQGKTIPFDPQSQSFQVDQGRLSVTLGDKQLIAKNFEVARSGVTVLSIQFQPSRDEVPNTGSSVALGQSARRKSPPIRVPGDSRLDQVLGGLDQSPSPPISGETLPKLPFPTQDEIDFVAVRRAAQQLIDLGCSVRLEGRRYLYRLPPGELHVTGVACWAESRIQNEHVQLLAEFPELEQIYFYSCPITDEGYASLPSLPRVDYVQYKYAAVGNRGLEALLDFPRLEQLALLHTDVTDEGLKLLGEMRHLQRLTLNAAYKKKREIEHGPVLITDEGLKHLAAVEDLTKLWILGPDWTDRAAEHLGELKHLPHLKEIKLWSPKLTDAAIPHLAALPNLRQILLGTPGISDEAMSRLRELAPRACRIVDQRRSNPDEDEEAGKPATDGP